MHDMTRLCDAIELTLETPASMPKVLWEHDGRKTVFMEFRDGSISAYGNVFCNRGALYKALGALNDFDAYRRLLEAIERAVKRGAEGVAENVREFREWYRNVDDLETFVRKLPAVRFYECDGGPYLTGSIIIGCVERSVCNASIHRMMRIDTKFVVRVVPRHLYQMLRVKRPLPVAVVLGAHPLVQLAASTSPPYGVFELRVAEELGWRGGVCFTPLYSLPVPCDASIVIEGILGAEYAAEGPFADILRLCDRVREQPVFEPKAAYISKEPRVWQILPGGKEHMVLMGFPREAAIWANVAQSVGRRPRVRLLESGGGWLSAVIAFDEIDHAHAKLAALAAIAAHPSLKLVIVTLDDINIDDEREVNWALVTRIDPARDVMVIDEIRGSTLDPASRDGIGSKLIIMALPRGDKKRFIKTRIIEGVDG